MSSPARILIVDDSPAMQQLFSLLLQPESDLETAAVAASAEEGWALFCREPPQVVILDLELPGRPGMDLLKRIMKERPTPVVIVSANGGEGSEATVTALAAGAVAFIEKPNAIDTSVEDFRTNLIRTLRMAARSGQPLARVAPRLDPAGAQPVQPQGALKRDKIVLVGASTGGVAAIQRLLAGIGNLPLPILVTQHMPPGYTRRFAERLQQTTAFEVKEAEEGDALSPGRVLIAPGDRHLTLAQSANGLLCRLDDGPVVSGHRPSVDVMFRSAAERIGQRAIAALLTGMGRDGAEGLLALKRAGAMTVVENEQTAVVFGMPKAALELGAADMDLALTAIPNWILRAASEQPAAVQAAPPRPAAAALAKDLRSKPLAAFRVLVVDDQKSMRGLAALALKQLGFLHVDEAESGEQALQAVRGVDYDLMLADWNMDGMTGLDLLKAVRKERSQHQIAVVMTTSESHVSKVSEAMAAGANNYLVKPCDAPKLRQRLERALMRSFAG
jgi:two-component system, chemotaxis family, protein-glutamate methylesterase/glutaminase